MKTFLKLQKINILIDADISESRLEVAKSLGADHTLLVGKEDSETLASKVANKLDAKSDVTIECSGAESSIRLAIFVIISETLASFLS